MKNRLFIALEVPKIILEEIILILKNHFDYYTKFNWESIEKLHFTLKFLGDTDVSLNSEIISALEKIISKTEKFDNEFDHFGLFFTNKNPKIFWINLKDNNYLSNFVNEIEEEMFRLGFEKEKRKFKPHLTLLRIKYQINPKIFDTMLGMSLQMIKFKSENISLIKSELLQSGSVYTTIKQFKLNK